MPFILMIMNRTVSALLGALLAMTGTALAQLIAKPTQPNPADPVWNFNTAAATLAKVGDAQLANAAYAVAPAFFALRFGTVRPRGWILEQMRRDLRDGFAGHLDELCREASSDIFATNRNQPGKPNSGNAEGIAWWNGETEGNWRCGHMMMACLTGEPTALAKAKAYIDHILAAQDADGYLGIFSPELRYKGNGDLWAQTCLFRGLLAYADATGDERVWTISADGTSLLLTSAQIAKPDRARFAWSSVAEPNLMNRARLPAAAFNTHWPKNLKPGEKP